MQRVKLILLSSFLWSCAAHRVHANYWVSFDRMSTELGNEWGCKKIKTGELQCMDLELYSRAWLDAKAAEAEAAEKEKNHGKTDLPWTQHEQKEWKL